MEEGVGSIGRWEHTPVCLPQQKREIWGGGGGGEGGGRKERGGGGGGKGGGGGGRELTVGEDDGNE